MIEFGPLDASQTAFLVNSGASRVTCIEARAENAIETFTAKQALGWDHVTLAMDDFHNASGDTYGRFDLAFAHGVYYHTIAPFTFLENLISLADNIFVGGFCATAENPATPYVSLEHGGHTYRAKVYNEGGSGDFYAGANSFAYFFDGDDLMEFFRRRHFNVQLLDDMSLRRRAPGVMSAFSPAGE